MSRVAEVLEDRTLLSRLFAVPAGDADTIVELDPETGAQINAFSVPSNASASSDDVGLAFDGTSLWYVDGEQSDDVLLRIDPDSAGTASIIGTIDLPDDDYEGLATVAGRVYAMNADDPVLEIDPATGTVTNTINNPFGDDFNEGFTGARVPGGLFAATDGDAVSDDIGGLSAATGSVSTPLFSANVEVGGLAFLRPAGFPDGLIYAGSDGGENVIERYDRDGSFVDTIALPFDVKALGGDDPVIEDTGARRLFAVPAGQADQIVELDSSTGIAINTFTVPSNASAASDDVGLAFDGTNLWYLDGDQTDDVLLQIDPDSTGTASILNAIDLPDEDYEGLGTVDGFVYVMDPDDTVLEVNPITGTVTDTIANPFGDDFNEGLAGAHGPGELFAATDGDAFSDDIGGMDPIAGTVSTALFPANIEVGGLAFLRPVGFADGLIYAGSDGGETTIERYDRDGDLVDVIPLPFDVKALGGDDPLIGQTLTVDAGDAGNDIVLRRDDTGTYYVVTVDGVVVAFAPRNSVVAIEINGEAGHDTLTVDNSNGLILVPTHFDGGTGLDELRLEGSTSVASSVYTPGRTLDAGTVSHVDGGDLQTVTFTGLEPVVDLVPAATLTVNGTNADNAINYSDSGGNGLVSVDGYETIEFANKADLVINGLAGSDTINLNNPSTPAGLTSITVDGGDPTAETDTLIVNSGAGFDPLVVEPGGQGEGTVDHFLALPDVDYDGIERITLVGQLADGDAFGVDGTTGDDVFEYFAGATPNEGLVLGTMDGNGFTLPAIRFQGMDQSAPLLFNTFGQQGGDDTFVFHGTDGVDEVSLTGSALTNTIGGVLAANLNMGTPIGGGTTTTVRILTGNGDDEVAVTPQAGVAIFVEGGNPSTGSDVLTFDGTGGDVSVDLDARTITEAGFGPVSYAGVESVDLDADGGALTVDGTPVDDTIAYTPQSATGGRFQLEGDATVFLFADVGADATTGAFTINGGDDVGDRVVLVGTNNHDLITIDSPNRTATLQNAAGTDYKQVTLGADVELLSAQSRIGNDTFVVIPAPTVGGVSNLLIDVDGGIPGASDTLVVAADGNGAALPASDFAVVAPSLTPGDGRVRVFRDAVAMPDVAYTDVEIVFASVADDANGDPQRLVFGPDPNEPNDARADSTFLGAGDALNADNLTIFSATTENFPAFLPLADQDWFQFVARETGTLDFQVYFDTFDPALLPGGGDLDIEVRDSNGDLVGTGTSTFQVQTVVGVNAGPAGTASIEVAGDLLSELTVGSTFTVRNASHEVIGTFTVRAGSTYDGVGDVTTINVDEAIAAGGAVATTATSADLVVTGERLTIPVTRNQTYFLRVAGADAQAVNAYEMTVVNVPAPVPQLVDLVAATDSGRSDTDDVTNVAAAEFDIVLDDDRVDEFLNRDMLPDNVADDAFTAGFDYVVEVFNNAVSIGFAHHTGGNTWRFVASPGDLVEGHANFVSAAVRFRDPATPSVEGRGGLSEPLQVTLDTIAPPVSIDGLLGDTGVPGDPTTIVDQITADTDTAFYGDAEADAIVRLFADQNRDDAINFPNTFALTVAQPFDGDEAFPNGRWQTPFVLDLNDPTLFPLLDGLREIFVEAEDLAGNVNTIADGLGDAEQQLEIFVDTQGPQLVDPDGFGPLRPIQITDFPDFDLFDPKPQVAATPSVDSLTLHVRDLPARVVDFLYDALHEGTAENPGHYLLVGRRVGTVPITNVQVVNGVQSDVEGTTPGAAGTASVEVSGNLLASLVVDTPFDLLDASGDVLETFTVRAGSTYDPVADTTTINVNEELTPADAAAAAAIARNVPGEPAFATIRLDFAEPLPDDRFTLTIGDSVVDPANNPLDGEADSTLAPPLISGDANAGGAFVTQFTVDSRPEIGFWSQAGIFVDANGNFERDPSVSGAVNGDLAFHFGVQTDHVFAGAFHPGPGAFHDGFDRLGAYGLVGGAYRFLLDFDNDGAVDAGETIVSNVQVNGIPVAGDFDNDDAGDEIGLFTGTTWWLDNVGGDNRLDNALTGNLRGFPIAGDFDGDGATDLATYRPDVNYFQFDLAANGLTGNADATIFFGFPGVLERPFAADFNIDGIDDIGLHVPDQDGQNGPAEWYILQSNAALQAAGSIGPLHHQFSPVPVGNDLFTEFGGSLAEPVVGNFDPPPAGGSATPNLPSVVPLTIDLRASSDTGDDDDNRTEDTTPTFEIVFDGSLNALLGRGWTPDGSLDVRVFNNGTPIGDATYLGTAADGSHRWEFTADEGDLIEGSNNHVSAAVVLSGSVFENGEALGVHSPPLQVTIDTIPPESVNRLSTFDVDGNAKVNFGDVARLIAGFMQDVADLPEDSPLRRVDFDESGRVDFRDMSFMVLAFGRNVSEGDLIPRGRPGSGDGTAVTVEQVESLATVALDRWNAAIDGAAELPDDLTLGVADLSGNLLALTVGSTVLIDVNAAGVGWFVDATPEDDAEFGADTDGDGVLAAIDGSPAADGVDLLTVLLHEVGHVLGLDDGDLDLMTPALGVGIRRILVPGDLDGVDDFFAEVGDATNRSLVLA